MNKDTKIWNHDGKPCTDCGKLYHYPTAYTIRAANKSEQNRKEGRISPAFDNVKDMMRWLDNDHAKLMNGECVCKDKNCKIN